MDFYKFWQILDGKLNEWDPNEPDEGPDDEYPRAGGDGEVERELKFENGTFVDIQSNKKWPAIIMDPKLSAVIGEPGDTYNMFARVSASLNYTPGQGEMGNPDGFGPEPAGEPELETEELVITNNRTGQSTDLSRNPVAYNGKIFSTYMGSVYAVDWDFHNGKVSLHIK